MSGPGALAGDPVALAELNRFLERQPAERRVEWALAHCEGVHAMTSSFGAQAAVSLHLINRICPGIPVLLVDTGYLFPETYRFIDTLVERLDLRLEVVQPALSPAWMEARHGRLWEQGAEGIDRYNRLRKVEPLQQAMARMGVGTWFSGLRRKQAVSRAETPVLERRHGRWKVHPIVDWSDRDVGRYLQRHGLPWHPLWEQGYVSIGDVHTTRRWEPGMREEDTRFFGLRRECGIHLEV
ncbi:MAG: phosphoadenosine phosphosulfate reductase [Lysobacteraceae bacterium]|nr:MAG: phosphoadenosine phosphosulfate reductase [Xanthomonadaceae bacterium]